MAIRIQLLIVVALWLTAVVNVAGAGVAKHQPTAVPSAVPAVEAEATVEPALPIDELISRAVRHSPMLAAMDAKIAATREMIAPAGALPDPMMELMIQEMGLKMVMEDSMATLQVTQAFPYPGKRQAKRDAAAAEVAVAEAERDDLQRQLIKEMRKQYADIYMLDREVESQQAAKDLLQMLSATAGTRYSSGQSDEEVLIKIQLQISRLNERLISLRAERAAMVAMINRRINVPPETPFGKIALLPEVSIPESGLAELAAAQASEVAIKHAKLSVAEKQLSIQRLELKPNFSVGAGGGSDKSGDPVLTLNLGLELPLWREHKMKPMIRAAEAEAAMAKLEMHDSAEMVRAEAARLLALWQKNLSLIKLYHEAIIPQTSALLDAARSSYISGMGDFSMMIEDFNMWLDTRMELAQRESEAYSTWAEVQALAPYATVPQQEEKRND